MLKTLSKISIEGAFYSRIIAICEKRNANIIFNEESLEAFPLSSGATQICSLSPQLFSIVLEDFAGASKQENIIKGIQSEHEEVKSSLFSACKILNIGEPKDSNKNLL